MILDLYFDLGPKGTEKQAQDLAKQIIKLLEAADAKYHEFIGAYASKELTWPR